MWHHVDNFNSRTGSATMELVKEGPHLGIGHRGGVAEYEAFHGVKYRD